MSEGLSENEISYSNSLPSNDKGEMNTSEEESNASVYEEDDSSVSATLGMEPYLFEPVVAVNQSGSESASEEDQGEAIWRLANTTWYVLELQGVISVTAPIYN